MKARKLKTGLAVWLAVLFPIFAACASGQDAEMRAAPPRIQASAGLPNDLAQGELFREIDDPSSGDCWLLLRDPKDPGGPGRLVLEKRNAQGPGREGGGPRAASATGSTFGSAAKQGVDRSAARLPVIHPGERLIVEENTPLVEARLEAVALNPARAGSVFKVRLAIGGKVVRARALGPGRAAFAEEMGAQP